MLPGSLDGGALRRESDIGSYRLLPSSIVHAHYNFCEGIACVSECLDCLDYVDSEHVCRLIFLGSRMFGPFSPP
jgi:hypothetical protein